MSSSEYEDNLNVAWSIAMSVNDDSLSYDNEDTRTRAQNVTHRWKEHMSSMGSDNVSETMNHAEKC